MAKPDTDDGWYKLAHELDTALAVADFTKAGRIVLREVFAQIYGAALSRTAAVSPSKIAKQLGRPRQVIERGISELVKAGVLVKQVDGTFRFVKDYERWTAADGTPRFTPIELAWIDATNDRVMNYKYALMGCGPQNPSSKEVAYSGTPMGDATQIDDKVPPKLMTPVINSDDKVPPKLMTNGGDNRGGRTGDNENRRTQARAGGAGYRSGIDADAEPFDPGGVEMPPSLKGPSAGSAEAAALSEWARSLGTDRNGESYAFWAAQQCDGRTPGDWIRTLLDRKVRGRSGNGRATVPLLTTILARWRDDGRADHERPRLAAGDRVSPSPPPPAGYYQPSGRVARMKANGESPR